MNLFSKLWFCLWLTAFVQYLITCSNRKYNGIPLSTWKISTWAILDSNAVSLLVLKCNVRLPFALIRLDITLIYPQHPNSLLLLLASVCKGWVGGWYWVSFTWNDALIELVLVLNLSVNLKYNISKLSFCQQIFIGGCCWHTIGPNTFSLTINADSGIAYLSPALSEPTTSFVCLTFFCTNRNWSQISSDTWDNPLSSLSVSVLFSWRIIKNIFDFVQYYLLMYVKSYNVVSWRLSTPSTGANIIHRDIRFWCSFEGGEWGMMIINDVLGIGRLHTICTQKCRFLHVYYISHVPIYVYILLCTIDLYVLVNWCC